LIDDDLERRRVVADVEARLFGDEVAPTTVGRFRIVRRVGVGALGIVYAAFDPALHREVALKVLRADRTGGGEGGDRERILAEARAMARLAHPHVVTVHEVGVHEGRVFIAMELVDGETLREWLAQPREWPEVLPVLLAAGRGLAAAHAAGLVHRDFKPDNVLVGRDARVRVTDFGLARASAGDVLTTTLAGTPAYMAPEQHDGLPCTPAADQFAFAVTACEALYGRRPFAGDDAAAMAAAKRAPLASVARAASPVPPRIERALLRGLAPTPDARWPSVTALLDALEHDPRRKTRRVVALVVVGLALAVALAAAFLQMWMFSTWRRG
jgi:serine/threonine protein kinase